MAPDVGKLQAMKFFFALKPVPGKRLAWLDTVGREAFGIEKLELALPVLDGTFKLLPLRKSLLLLVKLQLQVVLLVAGPVEVFDLPARKIPSERF